MNILDSFKKSATPSYIPLPLSSASFISKPLQVVQRKHPTKKKTNKGLKKEKKDIVVENKSTDDSEQVDVVIENLTKAKSRQDLEKTIRQYLLKSQETVLTKNTPDFSRFAYRPVNAQLDPNRKQKPPPIQEAIRSGPSERTKQSAKSEAKRSQFFVKKKLATKEKNQLKQKLPIEQLPEGEEDDEEYNFTYEDDIDERKVDKYYTNFKNKNVEIDNEFSAESDE